MILKALAALLLLAQAAPAPTAASATAPAETAAPEVLDPALVEVNRLMETWKDKPGDGLRGRLGLSTTARPANDGEVIFWTTRTEAMACGTDDTGALRCGQLGGTVCMLGIAFDKAGKVKSWKVSGAPDACRQFIAALSKSS